MIIESLLKNKKIYATIKNNIVCNYSAILRFDIKAYDYAIATSPETSSSLR
jgi:hypothetical protein